MVYSELLITRSLIKKLANNMWLAIVPAFNERERIAQVVASLRGVVDEVVVVNDGSRDDTAARAKAAGATVLSHRLNRGQGAALETGHAYARQRGAKYVIHFDGDGQLSVNDIVPAVQFLEEQGADIVLGSRFLKTTENIPWFKRHILLPAARWFHRLLVGLHLSDAHNGFRVLGPRALAHISLTQDRMAHATEILTHIKRHNLRWREFPVTVQYYEYGQGSRGAITIVRDLILGAFIKK